MSARRCKNRECAQKKCYSFTAVANAAIGTAKTLGKPVRWYRCPADGNVFHLTTQVRKVK